METESVRSETSGRSKRSRHHRSGRSSKSHRREGDMAPFQTSVQVTGGDGTRSGHDVVEVQILPQDENWGENTTALTGETSEGSRSGDDIDWPLETDSSVSTCRRRIGPVLTIALALLAWLSPLAMLALPQLGFTATSLLQPNQRAQLLACSAECKGRLVSLACKLTLLGAGVWAVPLTQRAFLPRVCALRAASIVALTVCVFAYWLFYIVQISEAERNISVGEEAVDYNTLVAYASSLVDTLIFLHYVGVLLTEVRQLEQTYYIKIVRSPDGESRAYSVGQLSIQRAAVWALNKYYTEFSIYNPYLEKVPICKSQRKVRSSIKFYDVDGSESAAVPGQTRSRTTSAAEEDATMRRRDSSSAHNERYYEEAERERRVRKRRARLLTAAEEAFAHVRRVRQHANNGALTPREAAQAVFPSLARSLQKFLRATRQQPRHSADTVLAHLANCLSQDASPQAFLEPFVMSGPVVTASESRGPQRWALVSPEPPARPLSSHTTFQLRQGDVLLSCTVMQLPEIRLTEELVDPKSNRFVLRLNSETSV